MTTTLPAPLATAVPQAPAKPKTPYGEMLQYYLKMEPQLFRAAVDQQLQRLKEEQEAKEEAVRKSQEEEESSTVQRSKSDLVLYQRMEEVGLGGDSGAGGGLDHDSRFGLLKLRDRVCCSS
jgi:hypothetical protein